MPKSREKNIAHAGLGSDRRCAFGASHRLFLRCTPKGVDSTSFSSMPTSRATVVPGVVAEVAHPGTIIIADNVVREGEIIDAAAADGAACRVCGGSMRWWPREPRLAATAIQTVGTKGYDGFVMAIVQV